MAVYLLGKAGWNAWPYPRLKVTNGGVYVCDQAGNPTDRIYDGQGATTLAKEADAVAKLRAMVSELDPAAVVTP